MAKFICWLMRASLFSSVPSRMASVQEMVSRTKKADCVLCLIELKSCTHSRCKFIKLQQNQTALIYRCAMLWEKRLEETEWRTLFCTISPVEKFFWFVNHLTSPVMLAPKTVSFLTAGEEEGGHIPGPSVVQIW